MSATSSSSYARFAHVRSLVEGFAEAAGMPFFKLDDEGSAAAMLEGGLYFEMQYNATPDRLFICVEMHDTQGDSVEAERARLVRNLQLMSEYGFSLARGQGNDSQIFLTTSIPVEGLDGELLGNTAVLLVEVARRTTGASTGEGGSGGTGKSQGQPIDDDLARLDLSEALDMRHLFRHL